MELEKGKRYFRVDGKVTGKLFKIVDEECFVDPLTGNVYSSSGYLHCESRPSMEDLHRECREEDDQRYQVAKDCLVALISVPGNPLLDAVETSIWLADEFLSRLEKNKEGECHE